MQPDLDDIDKGILRLLQRDGRISYAKIAKKLGTAESTVRFRVKRLLRSKVIHGFIALVDPRKVGFNISAVVLVKAEPSLLKEVVKQLAAFDEAHHVFQTTGEYDAIVVIHVRDMKCLNEVKQKIKMIAGVKDVIMWVATDLVKIGKVLPL